MTEMITKTEKQVKFDTWLDALRSGDYAQVKEALHVMDQGTPRYCCVGLLDEICYGTEWHYPPYEPSGDFTVYHDDAGEDTIMSPDRVADMDLDKLISPTEQDYFADKDVYVPTPTARVGALANANDHGYSFEAIADMIEELGWND